MWHSSHEKWEFIPRYLMSNRRDILRRNFTIEWHIFDKSGGLWSGILGANTDSGKWNFMRWSRLVSAALPPAVVRQTTFLSSFFPFNVLNLIWYSNKTVHLYVGICSSLARYSCQFVYFLYRAALLPSIIMSLLFFSLNKHSSQIN